MAIDKKFINQFANVTQKAALASSYFIGKKNKIAADKAAVDSMRVELNKIKMTGKVVIGEGTLDEAPMLYTGEVLGNKNGPIFDIAVDPVEGTNFVSNNLPGGIAVLAVGEKGNLFNAPETYMNKIATGKIDKGLIDLDYSLEKNIKNLSEFNNKPNTSLTVCILDRPRHKKIIDHLKDLKVKIKLISDGDILGALYVSDPKYNVDMFLGIGGGPEGVLAASALDSYDCHFQGRFIFDNEQDIIDARSMGITDLNKKYELNEIVKGDSIFCASGITNSEVLNGIVIEGNNFKSETLVTHKNSNYKEIVKSINSMNE
ncbi:class II fructose-bisphosphatase [Pelagibacteraceae bacterium]|nr:class II fructose-bisphosphatase [Candidatus Pelagibacter sp.]MDC1491081.1 class II fructose-bisphosphatase [Pelagibacteraceae bacterium]